MHGSDVDISINPGNVPTTAAGSGDTNCDNLPAVGEHEDGWVFVLQAHGDPDAHFNSVTATFTDNQGETQVLGATLVSGSGDNKAYIITEAGWTLVGATASVNTDKPEKATEFNLTHACPGTPPDEETTPPEEETTPPEEESTPPEEETTPPDEETTPPEEESTPPEEETTPPDEETTPPEEETTPPEEESTPPEESSTPPAEESTPPADETTPPRDDTMPTADQEQPDESSHLPQTGTAIGGLLIAATALATAGLGAYFLSRRRRAH